MFNNIFVVIDASAQLNFKTLTKHRVPGAIPILGKYRMIDVAISAATQANITNVGVFCDRNYRSLNAPKPSDSTRHVQSKVMWRLRPRSDSCISWEKGYRRTGTSHSNGSRRPPIPVMERQCIVSDRCMIRDSATRILMTD